MRNSRNQTIANIREALKRRSGKVWSVTGGRGTAWGWLTIDAPPARRTWKMEVLNNRLAPEFTDLEGFVSLRPYDARTIWTNNAEPGAGYSSVQDRCELAALLDLEAPVHCQGVSIPPDSWEVYERKAEGEVDVHEPAHNWD